MKFKRNWKSLVGYKSQLPNTKDLEKKNAAFYALPVADRRREIALDVLGLIFGGMIQESFGSYWGEKLKKHIRRGPAVRTSAELQQAVLNIPKSAKCEVCARGAMMLSTIRLGNNITPGDCGIARGDCDNQKHFTEMMFLNMEGVYEGGDPTNGYPYVNNSTESLANIFLQVLETGKFILGDKTDYLKKIVS